MKQIEFQVLEQSYTLGCPEGEESRLSQAVDKVDAAMRKIRDFGKVKARDRIAVLAALNIAFDTTEQTLSSFEANLTDLALMRKLEHCTT